MSRLKTLNIYILLLLIVSSTFSCGKEFYHYKVEIPKMKGPGVELIPTALPSVELAN